MLTGEIQIRVRYAETDQMGLLHHANYLVYFEQGRTELLRSRGLSYRDLEDRGYLLVLTKVEVRYHRPARYDDLLTLRTLEAKTFYVKTGHYLCLGDNSPESSDGRSLGLVHERLMLGRAPVVYYPFKFPWWPINFPVNRDGAIEYRFSLV